MHEVAEAPTNPDPEPPPKHTHTHTDVHTHTPVKGSRPTHAATKELRVDFFPSFAASFVASSIVHLTRPADKRKSMLETKKRYRAVFP